METAWALSEAEKLVANESVNEETCERHRVLISAHFLPAVWGRPSLTAGVSERVAGCWPPPLASGAQGTARTLASVGWRSLAPLMDTHTIVLPTQAHYGLRSAGLDGSL